MRLVGLALLCAVSVCWSPSWAYEEIAVTDGGTIKGTVTMTGGKPTPKGYNLITFPDPVYCGRISTGTGWRILDEFSMASSQGLKDVVVVLTDVTKGKPQLGPRVLFNTPLPMNPHHKRFVSAESHEHLAGEPVTEVIHMTKGRRIFLMQCGFHAYMESWGFAVDNPYFALTGDDGTFSLTDVPPGDYTLMVWHPGVGTMLQRKVTVTEKGLSNVDFDFKAPQGRRSVHEIEQNPHYGPESLGKVVDIRPTLQRQVP